MPLPALAAALIPAGLSLIGGLLKNKAENKRGAAEHESQRTQWDTSERSRAARAAISRGVAGGYGISPIFAEGSLDALATPQAMPKYAGGAGSLMGGIGSALGAAGSALAVGQDAAGAGRTPPINGSGASDFSEFANFQLPQLKPGGVDIFNPRPRRPWDR